MDRESAAYIVGAFEHPTRLEPEKTVAQLHAEVAAGAIADAGLSKDDIDGYFCAGDAPGPGALSIVDYLNLRARHVDSTETGGSSYLIHVAHAAQTIADGKCNIALITLAGRTRSETGGGVLGTALRPKQPDVEWEHPYDPLMPELYALAAKRHMHEYGTTSEQLAWIRVSASQHARHNPNVMMRDPVTVQDVLAFSMIADPLHQLDCCVVSDGGGALIVARPRIARELRRRRVKVIGSGTATKGRAGGDVDLTYSAAAWSGERACAQAGVNPADIQYASIYDSFTISVLMQLEDLGFCEKGKGGSFVADRNFISGVGKLPFDTDGGGQCNNNLRIAAASPRLSRPCASCAAKRIRRYRFPTAALRWRRGWGARWVRGISPPR